MGREVRRVPKDWKHPEDNRPLFDGFNERLKNWEFDNKLWDKGFRQSWKDNDPIALTDEQKEMTYSEWNGNCPRQEDYMPDWPEKDRTHYQMYETCSERSPISPVMDTPENLARWLADNEASAFGSQTAGYEQWLEMIRGLGWAPSAILSSEKGIQFGIAAGYEQRLLAEKEETTK